MNELALFAGAGGGLLGGALLGWRTVCAVEINPYRRKILLARQLDGILPRFPIWDDITTFNGFPWRGSVDVVSGGFPCQDISQAGKGAGLEGERSGLWSQFARIVGEIQPRHVFVENSPRLTIRGLGTILGDLATLGYDAEWGVLGARHCGGPMERKRIWIACTNQIDGQSRLGILPKQSSEILKRHTNKCPDFWQEAPSERFGMGDGVDSYVDQIEAIGDGQVPAVVALAWEMLSKRLTTQTQED